MVQEAEGEALSISYRRLAEWLVQRDKLPSDWRKRLGVIHANAQALASTTDGLQQHWAQDAGYQEACGRARQLAEAAPRGLLGSLTGSAADWAKVVKAYESKSTCSWHACSCSALSSCVQTSTWERQRPC